MVLGLNKRAVGVFSTRNEAEHALHELNNSGFPMNKISVIAKDDNQADIAGVDVQDKVGNKADEGASAGALTGGVLGGATGLLVGLGALAIPGVGPIVLAGEVATALATTLAGGAIGAAAGGLIGALVGLGIPEKEAKNYNDRVSRGHYLVMVDGNDAEIARAETILTGRGIEDFGIYDRPDSTPAGSYTAGTSYAEPDTLNTTATSVVSDRDNVTTGDPKVVIVDRREEI
ncbi:general stress protein [Synechocystis sp. PCC 7509]|uniref:general stress protein n=1 Tax=Synechocystis sp. PCC 7509 TaxID=927677 RepID=UPI0002AC1F61|nr:general stress protein [Synechocystis sp. PCC 7509]